MMSKRSKRKHNLEKDMTEENAIGNPPSPKDLKETKVEEVNEPKPNVEPAYKPNKEEKEHPVASKVTTTTTKVNVSARQTTIENRLKQYVDVMTAGKSVSSIDIGKAQYGFYQFLRSVLQNSNPSEFSKEWNYILHFANTNKEKVFNMYQAFQGAAEWTGSNNDWVTYRKLMFLIIDTMGVSNRRTNINLKEVVEGTLKVVERNNILNFYG